MLSQLLCFIEDDNSSHLIITLQVLIPISLSSLAAPVARLYGHLNMFILKKTCEWGHVCVEVRGQIGESVLPFHVYMGSWNQTQGIRLVQQELLPT